MDIAHCCWHFYMFHKQQQYWLSLSYFFFALALGFSISFNTKKKNKILLFIFIHLLLYFIYNLVRAVWTFTATEEEEKKREETNVLSVADHMYMCACKHSFFIICSPQKCICIFPLLAIIFTFYDFFRLWLDHFLRFLFSSW